MKPWSNIILATEKYLKKHYLFLAVLHLSIQALNFMLGVLAHRSFLILFLYLSVLILSTAWLQVATYQIITQDKFDFSWQFNLLKSKLGKWLWTSMLTMHEMILVIFPLGYKSIKKIGELYFALTEVLFGDNENIDALKKSKALVGGNEWTMVFIFVMFVAVLPAVIGRGLAILTAGGLNSTIMQLVISGLLTPIHVVFAISMWKIRSTEVTITPEPNPVDYKYLAIKTLPKAIPGFIYLILISVGFVLLFTVYGGNIE